MSADDARKVARGFRSPRLRWLFETAVAQGWGWRRSGAGHIIILPPDGSQPVSLSITAYDGSQNEKLVSRARRAGLKDDRRNGS